MTASAFNDARSNWSAFGQVEGIVHERQIACKVVGCFDELGALGDAHLRLVCQGTEFCNELFGLSSKELPGVSLHPGKALSVGFPEQGIGDLPQILVCVDEIQDQDKVGKLLGETSLQGLATITESNFMADVASQAGSGLFG